MKTSALQIKHPQTTRRLGVPLLLNGDHLSVPEFERRYEAMQDDGKAELIEGIVFMAPPVSDDHGKSNSLLGYLLGHYAAATPGVAARVNTSIRLDGSNEYQPDVMLRFESGKMAGAKAGASGILEGRPELVVEIALSSAAYDLHEKKAVYQRNRIPEYVVWEVMESRIHWFALEGREYVQMKARPDGVTHSRVFPGLWLDLLALLADDERKAFRVVNMGLKSAEHKAFIKKLAASSTVKKTQPKAYLRITEAEYVSGYKIRLTFNDGTVRVMDFEPFLDKARNPEFTKYRQMRKFKSFRLDHGDLMWGDYEMIFPITNLHRGEI